jgi:hypothetical protein
MRLRDSSHLPALTEKNCSSIHSRYQFSLSKVTDLSQKFVDFYDSSVGEHADPDRRWKLWKSKYDFAAVPPIPAGQKMAREQLDAAWAKYPRR